MKNMFAFTKISVWTISPNKMTNNAWNVMKIKRFVAFFCLVDVICSQQNEFFPWVFYRLRDYRFFFSSVLGKFPLKQMIVKIPCEILLLSFNSMRPNFIGISSASPMLCWLFGICISIYISIFIYTLIHVYTTKFILFSSISFFLCCFWYYYEIYF